MKRAIAAGATLMVAAPAWAVTGDSFLGIPDTYWKLVNLLLFLALLGWFVGRPLLGFLTSRRASIGAELAEARRKLAEAEQLRAEVLGRLDQVEREVDELRQRAEAEGEAEQRRIGEDAAVEEARFLKRVEEEITRRTLETRQRLAEDTATLTAQLARELLEREVGPADRQLVLERSLAALRHGEGD